MSQLMGCVSNESSDEHVHLCSLARAITVSAQRDCTVHQLSVDISFYILVFRKNWVLAERRIQWHSKTCLKRPLKKKTKNCFPRLNIA